MITLKQAILNKNDKHHLKILFKYSTKYDLNSTKTIQLMLYLATGIKTLPARNMSMPAKEDTHCFTLRFDGKQINELTKYLDHHSITFRELIRRSINEMDTLEKYGELTRRKSSIEQYILEINK